MLRRQSAVRRPTTLSRRRRRVDPAVEPRLRRCSGRRLRAGQLRLGPRSQPRDERLSRAPAVPRPEVPLTARRAARVDRQVARRRRTCWSHGGGGGRSDGIIHVPRRVSHICTPTVTAGVDAFIKKTSGYAMVVHGGPKTPINTSFLGVTQPPGVAQPLYSRGHN